MESRSLSILGIPTYLSKWSSSCATACTREGHTSATACRQTRGGRWPRAEGWGLGAKGQRPRAEGWGADGCGVRGARCDRVGVASSGVRGLGTALTGARVARRHTRPPTHAARALARSARRGRRATTLRHRGPLPEDAAPRPHPNAPAVAPAPQPRKRRVAAQPRGVTCSSEAASEYMRSRAITPSCSTAVTSICSRLSAVIVCVRCRLA
eukprot:428377-Prymnesium_polylepis.3